jgi:hypothetical protein
VLKFNTSEIKTYVKMRCFMSLVRSLIGIFLPPVDAAWGVLKDIAGAQKKAGDPAKQEAKKIFNIPFKCSRILTLAITAFCIVGFIGALAVPIPGVAPLYAIGVLGILKAVGVTIAWSSAARMAGALIGSLYSNYKVNSLTNEVNSKKKTFEKCLKWLKLGVLIGIAGEKLAKKYQKTKPANGISSSNEKATVPLDSPSANDSKIDQEAELPQPLTASPRANDNSRIDQEAELPKPLEERIKKLNSFAQNPSSLFASNPNQRMTQKPAETAANEAASNETASNEAKAIKGTLSVTKRTISV